MGEGPGRGGPARQSPAAQEHSRETPATQEHPRETPATQKHPRETPATQEHPREGPAVEGQPWEAALTMRVVERPGMASISQHSAPRMAAAAALAPACGSPAVWASAPGRMGASRSM